MFFEPLAFLPNQGQGLPDLNPVSVTNKSFETASMPAIEEESGSDTGSNWQSQDTKSLPVASLLMVPVDGAEGHSGPQRMSDSDLLKFPSR